VKAWQVKALPLESLQPARFDLTTNKKLHHMRISQNSSARFKFVRCVIATATQLVNEPEKIRTSLSGDAGQCVRTTDQARRLARPSFGQTFGCKCTTPFNGDLRVFF
jgi:hypothetical protein